MDPVSGGRSHSGGGCWFSTAGFFGTGGAGLRTTLGDEDAEDAELAVRPRDAPLMAVSVPVMEWNSIGDIVPELCGVAISPDVGKDRRLCARFRRSMFAL